MYAGGNDDNLKVFTVLQKFPSENIDYFIQNIFDSYSIELLFKGYHLMQLIHRRPLNLFDFIILSCIFFAYFSYISLLGYFSTPVLDPISVSSFSESANWTGIAVEAFFLSIAMLYLWWRKFDFALLNFSCNRYTLPLTILLIILGSLTTDLILYGGYWLQTGEHPFALTTSFDETHQPFFAHITWSLICFALFNGFYEELFFMGLTFATHSKYRPYAFIISILVRFLFHTYQGLSSALAIAFTGIVFLFIRRKTQSITPFILAHAVFDVFGAGFIF